MIVSDEVELLLSHFEALTIASFADEITNLLSPGLSMDVFSFVDFVGPDGEQTG